MSKDNMVLATNIRGRDLTVKDCRRYLSNGNKIKLSNFIYNRLYGRYLKPFDFHSSTYAKKYKSGFALMASCCLLIETYVSFKEAKYKDTYRKSRDCFGYFFTTEPRFSEFSQGGVPNDFYFSVRCGILHNAETRDGWKITRKQEDQLFNPNEKKINATKFANRLKYLLLDYKQDLRNADFDNDQIWLNFKDRLDFLMNKI